MTFAELLADHKGQLGKVAERFTAPDDADFKRHLRRAGQRMALKEPLWKVVEIALVAKQALYPAPADFLAAPLSQWGRSGGCANPWDENFVGFAPSLTVEVGEDGPMLRLSIAPTPRMLHAWGTVLP